ncbi:uncharacterized protein [Typha latifolia]|uniref:uncharacterized protein n=1 Tax=Typha latifolia TaxID=4733 RepID=UPI003C2F85AC
MDAKDDAPEQPSTAVEEKPAEFDPSRMIGIIKRKALIKELAAAYHAECLSYCKELLQLQRKWEEQHYFERKALEDAKPSKRRKKGLKGL